MELVLLRQPGQKSKPKKCPFAQSMTVAIAFMLHTGCGHTTDDSALYGTWRLTNVPGHSPQRKAQLLSAFQNETLELKADHTFREVNGDIMRAGTWSATNGKIDFLLTETDNGVLDLKKQEDREKQGVFEIANDWSISADGKTLTQHNAGVLVDDRPDLDGDYDFEFSKLSPDQVPASGNVQAQGDSPRRAGPTTKRRNARRLDASGISSDDER